MLRNLHQLFVLCTASQIIGGEFAKFCGLLRSYELYKWLGQLHLTTFILGCDSSDCMCCLICLYSVKLALQFEHSLSLCQIVKQLSGSCQGIFMQLLGSHEGMKEIFLKYTHSLAGAIFLVHQKYK